MKTRLLILTGFSILLQLFLITPAYSAELSFAIDCPITHKFDPDTKNCEIWLNSIFVMVPIQLGIISLLLIIPHLILKKKKIPSRPYVVLIAAAIMLFIGIPNFIQGMMILFMILINEHLMTLEYLSATVPFMILGVVLVGGGMALLAKSKLIRNFIERK